MNEKKNVLISDANHGGLVLLEEYSKFTENNLFFYDVYDKLSDDEKSNLEKRFNVTFLSLDDIKGHEDDFVKVNPVHMPPVIGTDFIHHEFVGYLLKNYDFSFRIVQVTGVKGKTTVTSLIGDVLKDYNTLVLTSDALTYNDKVLMEHLSITPASVITALNIAKEEHILDFIDFCVFEVSLGVVPGYDLNVLTNILEDYSIAGKNSSASAAKKSAFSSDMTLCDFNAFNEFYSNQNCVCVSFDNPESDVFVSDIKYDIDNTRFTLNYFDEKIEIKHFALSDFYINNIAFAVSAGLMLNVDKDNIISNLSDSSTVNGRNSYKKINDKIIIEDINPGLNTTSIKKCVDNLDKFNIDYIIIIGGDYGITCEEIDEDKLASYINTINNVEICLAGQLGKKLKSKLDNNYPYFKLLDDAIDYCVNRKDERLVQVIYRNRYYNT